MPEDSPLLPPAQEIAPEISPAEEGLGLGDQMENRIQVLIGGNSSLDQPLIDRVERTGLGRTGFSESTRIHLTIATGCQHVLHTGSEVGGLCADGCGRMLCTYCATQKENLCGICGRPVAGPCRRHLWLVPHLGMVCRRCRRHWWAQELLVTSTILLAAAGGIWLLWHRFL